MRRILGYDGLSEICDLHLEGSLELLEKRLLAVQNVPIEFERLALLVILARLNRLRIFFLCVWK